MIPSLLSRRALLQQSACGFGSLALRSLLGPTAASTSLGGGDDIRPRQPHFAPRAKRMVFLFMHGGPSQVDTFDYKPLLQRDHGKPLPFAKPRVTFAETGNLMGSPFRFAQHGQSGQWVSELFPHLARCVDQLCFLKALHGSNDAHGGALLKIHTGSDTFVRPSIGSWALYGLGTENQNLPGFVTICPTLGHGGVNNWSSAFLPAVYQGTPLGNASVPAEQAAVRHLHGELSRPLQRAQLDLVQQLNAEHQAQRQGDDILQARIQSFELAFRMQMEAPTVLDVDAESDATKRLYGLERPATQNFGRQCLMARRLLESGVRFVQCTHSYKWDQHNNLEVDHRKNANEVDQPIAGLLTDLQQRGLLEDTLVWWGGEFGRTPVSEGGTGRDHNPHAFTHFLAGGGVRQGFSYGVTDDYGYYTQDQKMHVHDLHATILHLLGLDHERLTWRHAGRDFRLTDVEGKVARAILA
ncbi:MAG: DUF1501 domain-containing protein [Planctomycetes bacterium]|jgi:hypothetical protein|nr:DUF1501 domain-containing protein [Planctomycetota bacterium]